MNSQQDLKLQLEELKNRRRDLPIYILRLPNIFGIWAKPNFNSVIATFCYNTANNLKHNIVEPNRVLELVHIDDLCSQLNLLIENKNSNLVINLENTYKITVKELSYIISNFKSVEFDSDLIYKRTKIEKNLYKIYLSFLKKK